MSIPLLILELEMTKESVLYTVIGLLVGVMATVFVAQSAVNRNNTSVQRMMGMHITTSDTKTTTDNSMGMDAMVTGLNGKTGDDFDKAFLSEMIVHHQGAIEMARLAQANAKHPELKALADGIIAAQSSEISQMKLWQTAWGYGSTDTSMGGMHMSH
jgi:uncharacterized protein (DUF305 family)